MKNFLVYGKILNHFIIGLPEYKTPTKSPNQHSILHQRHLLANVPPTNLDLEDII